MTSEVKSVLQNQRQNYYQLYQMFKFERTLSIRSQESYEFSEAAQTDRSNCLSIDSNKLDPGDVSQTIKELILEEKRNNFACKSDVNYKPQNLKRFHSLSMIYSKRQGIQLPIHLERLLTSNRKCPNIAINDQLDAIYGAFFGFLIGDIVGAHIVYKVHSLLFYIPQALVMNGGGTYNLGPGQGTQQTQLLFSMCYGLIEGGEQYNKGIMAEKYLKWIQTKPFNVSAIFLLAINEIKKKKAVSPQISSQEMGSILVSSSLKNKNHQSNLGLIRILPLVIWGLELEDAEFFQLIKNEMSLICPNQLVTQTGFVFGMMLRTIIKTRDHQLAFYEAARWVYSKGSSKLKQLWKYVELDINIQSTSNLGKLKTAFAYACCQINKNQVIFMDSLLKTLLKGGQTDANCAIVMALVGSIVGYNQIPSYFKQKILNFRMNQSSRPRNQQFTPYKVVDVVENLMKIKPIRNNLNNAKFSKH